MVEIYGRSWKLKENATEENFEEVTSEVTGQVSETGTVLGLDNCTDFDEFGDGGNGEFWGYDLSSPEFGEGWVSEIGLGKKIKK